MWSYLIDGIRINVDDKMPINYQELGFKCGLEIHQQLEGKKLFCNCPTLNSDKEPNIKFERKLLILIPSIKYDHIL